MERIAHVIGNLRMCSRKLSDVPFYFMKGHYLFINAALACVIPYVHIYAKDRGISADKVGYIFSLLPFLTMVAKPAVGWIVDCRKKLKCMMVSLLCVIMLGCLLLIFIPPLRPDLNGHLSCLSHGTSFTYVDQPDLKCVADIPENKTLRCSVSCKECSLSASGSQVLENGSINADCESSPQLNGRIKMVYGGNRNKNTSYNITSIYFAEGLRMNTVCLSPLHFMCQAVCSRVVHKCYLVFEKSSEPVLQFWMFLFAVIFIQTTFGIISSLSDVACFNLLGDQVHLYGRQRLWGTIGWALASPLSAALNYAITQRDDTIYALYEGPVFNFGFSLTFCFLILDFSYVKSLVLDNVVFSKSIVKDIGVLLIKPEIFMFLISVFKIGVLTGIFWTFLFWHLRVLGAPFILLGFATAVQCLVGELPFFFFAGSVINRIGHFNTLTINLVAFGIRFVLYSFLKNPWWVLPIEILQGPTYGLFYTAMATYASVAAVPGTEATMQGLVGGTFEGLGVAVGALVGGWAMENYGGKQLFLWTGIGALCYALVNIFFTVFVKCRTEKNPEQSAQPERQISDAQSPNEVTSFI